MTAFDDEGTTDFNKRIGYLFLGQTFVWVQPISHFLPLPLFIRYSVFVDLTGPIILTLLLYYINPFFKTTCSITNGNHWIVRIMRIWVRDLLSVFDTQHVHSSSRVHIKLSLSLNNSYHFSTHFMSMIGFYTAFSGSVKREHWLEMG